MEMTVDPPAGETPEAPPEPAPRRRGRLACVANMKGGVGKTTASVMLAEGLAAMGRSVLVLDIDPQASASVALVGDAALAGLAAEGRLLDEFLRRRLVERKKAGILDAVRGGASRTYDGQLDMLPVSLLACSQGLRSVERQAVRALSKKGDWDHVEREVHALMRDEVAGPLLDAYDWVLVDCAPGLGLLTAAALALADVVVVATVPEPLSVYGLDGFIAHGWAPSDGGMPAPAARPNVLATCVLANDEGHARTLAHLREAAAREGAPFSMLGTSIGRAPNLSGTAFMGEAPVAFETKYTQAQRAAMAELAAEIEEGALARA